MLDTAGCAGKTSPELYSLNAYFFFFFFYHCMTNNFSEFREQNNKMHHNVKYETLKSVCPTLTTTLFTVINHIITQLSLSLSLSFSHHDDRWNQTPRLADRRYNADEISSGQFGQGQHSLQPI